MAKKNNKGNIKKLIRIHLFLTVATVFLYLSLGFFAGWDIIFSDIQNKGKVAGASISAVVRVFGPPSKPLVTAVASCTSQENSYINLSWELDEDATEYDVYRNGAELMLGLAENSLDDLSVTEDNSYSYYVVAKGPQGTATSDTVTATAMNCQSENNPEVFVETFRGRNISSWKNVPETTQRKPLIQGQTNIPYAIIELQIHDSQNIYATTEANFNGYWQWSSPVNLSLDFHTLYIQAIDQIDSSITANTSFTFEIKEKEESKENEDEDEDEDNEDSESEIISSSGYSSANIESEMLIIREDDQQEKMLIDKEKPFDFETEIKNDAYVKGVSISEEAYRGENLKVNVAFTETAKENEEISLKYTLSSLDQKVLTEYNDSIKIDSGREITKKIPLPYDLELGKYKLQVSATIDSTTVSHESYFILKDRPVLQLGTGYISYADLTNNIGWLMLASFFILFLLLLVAIWEHHLTQRVVSQVTGKILKKKGFIN